MPAEVSDEQVAATDPERMLAVAVQEAQAMAEMAAWAGVRLFYGENWVYAPAIQQAERLMAVADGAILEMRGGECHRGSHSPYSKQWRHTGGTALLRLGSHPIGAMLYLKIREGLRRSGRPIRPVAVTAEVADLSRGRDAERRRVWIETGWRDVENWATTIVTFDDGSRGVVHASDAVLGGLDSTLEICLTNGRFKCQLSRANLLQAYTPHPDVFGDAYLIEKLDTGAGWSTPMPDEDWTSGHQAMCQDLAAATAENRPALAGGALGVEVVRVVYSAYLAAATGHRMSIPPGGAAVDV